MNWFACELHCHTIHSDGGFTPAELVAAAKAHQLDGIAITDHNTISSTAEVCAEGEKQGLTILKGVEWTTFYGHMLVQHPNNCLIWYDTPIDGMEASLKTIREKGGFAGVAHAMRPGNPMGTGCRWEFAVEDWSDMGYIEILHGENPSFGYYNAYGIDKWKSLLDQGYRLTATSGIDWHHPLKPDCFYACTYLGTNGAVLSEDAMFTALKSHKTSLSMGMRIDFTLVHDGKTYHIGDTVPPCHAEVAVTLDWQTRREIWHKFDITPHAITIESNNGVIAYKGAVADAIPALTLTTGNWYVAQLHGTIGGKEGIIAITSPIFCAAI